MRRFACVFFVLQACSSPASQPGADGGGGVCPGEAESCSGECVDTTSDEQHCGACGVTCGVDQTCVDSECIDGAVACQDGLPGAWSVVVTGKGPSRMVGGDFDADGYDDFAVLNRTDHSVTIALGAGAGRFVTSEVATPRQYPRYLTGGDVNGDGAVDLIYSAWDPDGVGTLLNDGSGGFSAGPEIDVPASADQVAAGDFDGDGRLDVVVGTVDSGRALAFLQGTASGFTNRGTFPIAREAELDAADLDGDGADELVFVARPDFDIEGDDVRVGTLRLSASGIEVVSETYTIGLAHNLALGDVTGDGNIDLVVPGTARGVMVMPGAGDGSFAGGEHMDIDPGGAYGVALADLDADGDLDIAVSSGTEFGTFNEVGTVSILHNDGAGELSLAQVGTVGGDPSGITIGDYDSDGVLDVATARHASADVAVLQGRGDGQFVLPRSLPVRSRVGELHTGDVDEDGRVDLVTISWSGQWSVALNTDSGFSMAPQSSAFISSLAGGVADFDGDGHLDVVVTTSLVGPAAAVLYGDGTGNFADPVEIPGPYSLEMEVGDMNGDGRPDVVVDPGFSPLLVAYSSPSRGFDAPVEVDMPADSERIAIADLTGDGRPDIVVATNKWQDPDPDAIYLIAQRADGAFDPAVSLVSIGNPTELEVADVDGDGHLDLVVGRHSALDALQISYGGPGLQFSQPVSLPLEPGPYTTSAIRGLVVADVDADGDLDVVGSDDAQRVTVFGQTAPRQLVPSRTLPIVDAPWALAVVDFDGDGHPEIAAGNRHEPAVSVVAGGCP